MSLFNEVCIIKKNKLYRTFRTSTTNFANIMLRVRLDRIRLPGYVPNPSFTYKLLNLHSIYITTFAS